MKAASLVISHTYNLSLRYLLLNSKIGQDFLQNRIIRLELPDICTQTVLEILSHLETKILSNKNCADSVNYERQTFTGTKFPL